MTDDAAPITDEARAAVEQILDVSPLGPDATIYERMVAILSELPAIGKTEYNKQQQFHFRGHDAVLNALNPLLAKHGVFVIPNVLERIADQRTTGGGKAMYEVNLHMEFVFCGLAGDEIRGSTWGEGTDMGDKATNKAMTMAFKAVLAQAFSVSTGENTDSDADTPEETTGRSGGGGRGSTSRARQEPAGGGVKLPVSWSEWSDRMAVLGVPVRDQAMWLEDAAGLDKNDKWAKARKLLVILTEREGVDFQTEPRRIIQEAIAQAFDGLAASGPPWQIIAAEEHLPTFDDYQQTLADQDADLDVSESSEDEVDIPFGDDPAAPSG